MKGLTPYQFEMLQHVRDAGSDIDFDQLLEKLSWAPSKEAAQFTVRALVGKKLLEKSSTLQLRRGRRRVTYLLTGEGKRVFDPRGAAAPEKVVGKPGPEATADFSAEPEKLVETFIPGPEDSFLPGIEDALPAEEIME